MVFVQAGREAGRGGTAPYIKTYGFRAGGTGGGTRRDVPAQFLVGGTVPPRLGFIKLKSGRGGAQDGQGGSARWAPKHCSQASLLYGVCMAWVFHTCNINQLLVPV